MKPSGGIRGMGNLKENIHYEPYDDSISPGTLI